MKSKIRKKICDQLKVISTEECSILEDACYDMGTIHEDLIRLAYRYAPLKELKKLIEEGTKEINRLNKY